MSRIFISYARKYEDFARQLATALSDAGAEIWLDVKDIPAGMKWSTAIQQGLDTCEVMLVIITPESMASVNVEDEWQYYLDKKKPIIPILLKPTPIHFQLNRLQWIDFHKQDFDFAFKQLRDELKIKLEGNAIKLKKNIVSLSEQNKAEVQPQKQKHLSNQPHTANVSSQLPRTHHRQALILANGEINDGEMVQRTLMSAHQPFVVAVDGGARIAQHFKLRIDVLVGDLDSLSVNDYYHIVDSGTEIQRHPIEKDYSDLELALMMVGERGYNWIRIIGGVGGRLDHTLANIYLLALLELENYDIRIVSNNQEVYMLTSGEHRINGHEGDTLSLIPLGGAVHDVYTENLYYPLNHETLKFGPARGISNIMMSDTAKVSIGSGTLLIIHTLGRA